MTEPILIADIGGTNARFALAKLSGDQVDIIETRKYLAEDFETVCDAAKHYLETFSVQPKIACFAVAGPVTDEQVEFTNSQWVLNIADVQKSLSLSRLAAVNDFEALAAGVRSLREKDFLEIKPGRGDPNAPVVVLGPGTGLGQSLIVPCEGHERIIPTEGGHVAFAARTEEEFAVMRHIMRDHPRVSVERILSGPGLVNLYRALCAIEGAPCNEMLADEITAAAISGAHAPAVKTVNMFCGLLGSVAGDAVLSTGARGGVVLGGGILPKIRELFVKSAFVERFLEKGRMRYFVEDAPVRLIIGEGAALAGAAAIAIENTARLGYRLGLGRPQTP